MGYYYKSFKYRPEAPEVLYSVGAKQTGSAYYDTKFSTEGINVDPHGVGYFVADERELVKHNGEWVDAQNVKESILDAMQYAKNFVNTDEGWEWGVWKVEGTPASIADIRELYEKGLLSKSQPLIGRLVKDLRIVEKVDYDPRSLKGRNKYNYGSTE